MQRKISQIVINKPHVRVRKHFILRTTNCVCRAMNWAIFIANWDVFKLIFVVWVQYTRYLYHVSLYARMSC